MVHFAKTFVSSFVRRDRGAASVLFVASLPAFVLLAGLAIDSTAAYSEQSILQAAANSAALAGTLELRSNPASTAIATAQTYATKNLPAATNGTVLKSADVKTGYWNFTTHKFESCPGAETTCTDSNPVNAVQVIVKHSTDNKNPLPTAFLGFINRSGWNISALAIAAIPSGGGSCVVFGSSGAGGAGLIMKNGGSITSSGCGVQFDGGLTGGNNNTVTATSGGTVSFGSSAGSSCGSVTGVTFSPTPVCDAPAPNDPYANTPIPSPSSCVSAATTIDGSHPPTATCYSGSVTINGPVILPNNTYVFDGAQITVSGTITTNGSTLILTGSTSAGWATISGTNNITLNLTAPTTGTYQGLALFGDPAGGTNVSITATNNFTMNVTGAVYMPKGAMSLKNGTFSAATCLQVDVGTMTVKNNLNLSSSPSACGSSSGVFAIGHGKLVL